MRLALLACLLLLIQGCSDAPAENVKAAKRAARIESADAALSKIPPIRSYRYDSGQLLVFEIPFKDSDGLLETHRCLVWRDAEFKSASLSCPHESPDFLPDIQ